MVLLILLVCSLVANVVLIFVVMDGKKPDGIIVVYDHLGHIVWDIRINDPDKISPGTKLTFAIEEGIEHP